MHLHWPAPRARVRRRLRSRKPTRASRTHRRQGRRQPARPALCCAPRAPGGGEPKQVYAKTASLTPPGSSSQGIPDGRGTLIELWVLDPGNRSTAGASGQPCPQHNPCGRGRPSGRQTVRTVGVPLCGLWIKVFLDTLRGHWWMNKRQ